MALPTISRNISSFSTPSNNNNAPPSNAVSSSSFMASLADQRAKLFEELRLRDVIDKQGILKPAYQMKTLPRLPAPMVRYLYNKFHTVFSFMVGKVQVENTMGKLMSMANVNRGQPVDLKLNLSYLYGECVIMLLFSKEFDYLRMVFRQCGIEDIYDKHVAGKEWLVHDLYLKNGTEQTYECLNVCTPCVQHQLLDVSKFTLDMHFQRFVDRLTNSQMFPLAEVNEAFAVKKYVETGRHFHDLSFPNSGCLWTWQGTLYRKPLFSLNALTVPLSFLFSSSYEVYPENLMQSNLQPVFDVLFKVARAPKLETMDFQGWSCLQLCYAQGYTSADKTTEPILFQKHCEQFSKEAPEEKLQNALLQLMDLTSFKAKKSSEKWTIFFNASSWLNTTSKNTLFFPQFEDLPPLLKKIDSLLRELSFRVGFDILELTATFAHSVGVDCESHDAFTDPLFEMAVEENVHLRLFPKEGKLEDIGPNSLLEEFLDLLLNSPTSSRKKEFQHAHNLCTFTSPPLQFMGLYWLGLTQAKEPETISLFLKLYPVLLKTLTTPGLKRRLTEIAKNVLGENLPDLETEPQEKWGHFLLNHFADETDICCSFLKNFAGHQRSFFSYIPSLVSTSRYRIATTLLHLVEKHEKKPRTQIHHIMESCNALGESITSQGKLFILERVLDIKAYLSRTLLKKEEIDEDLFLKTFEKLCMRLLSQGNETECIEFVDAAYKHKDILFSSSTKEVQILSGCLEFLFQSNDVQEGCIQFFAQKFETAFETYPFIFYDRKIQSALKLMEDYFAHHGQVEKGFLLLLRQLKTEKTKALSEAQSNIVLMRLKELFSLDLQQASSPILDQASEALLLILPENKLEKKDALLKSIKFVTASFNKGDFAKKRDNVKILEWILNELEEDTSLFHGKDRELCLFFIKVLEKCHPIEKHLTHSIAQQISELLHHLFIPESEAQDLGKLVLLITQRQMRMSCSESAAILWVRVLETLDHENDKNTLAALMWALQLGLLKYESEHKKVVQICINQIKHSNQKSKLLELLDQLLPLVSLDLRISLGAPMVDCIKETSDDKKKLEWLVKLAGYFSEQPKPLIICFVVYLTKLAEKKPLEAIEYLSSSLIPADSKPNLYRATVRSLLQQTKKLEDNQNSQNSKNEPRVPKERLQLLSSAKKLMEDQSDFFDGTTELWVELMERCQFWGLVQEMKEIWEYTENKKILVKASDQRVKVWYAICVTSKGRDHSLLIKILEAKEFKEIFHTQAAIPGTIGMYHFLSQDCKTWIKKEEGKLFELLVENFDDFKHKCYEQKFGLRFQRSSDEKPKQLIKKDYVAMNYQTVMYDGPDENFEEKLSEKKIGIMSEHMFCSSVPLKQIEVELIAGLFTRDETKSAFDRLKAYLDGVHNESEWQNCARLLNVVVPLIPKWAAEEENVIYSRFLPIEKLLSLYEYKPFDGLEFFEIIPFTLIFLNNEKIRQTYTKDILSSCIAMLEHGCNKEKLCSDAKTTWELFEFLFKALFKFEEHANSKYKELLSRLITLTIKHRDELQKKQSPETIYHFCLKAYCKKITLLLHQPKNEGLSTKEIDDLQKCIKKSIASYLSNEKLISRTVKALCLLDLFHKPDNFFVINHMNEMWKVVSGNSKRHDQQHLILSILLDKMEIPLPHATQMLKFTDEKINELKEHKKTTPAQQLELNELTEYFEARKKVWGTFNTNNNNNLGGKEEAKEGE